MNYSGMIKMSKTNFDGELAYDSKWTSNNNKQCMRTRMLKELEKAKTIYGNHQSRCTDPMSALKHLLAGFK